MHRLAERLAQAAQRGGFSCRRSISADRGQRPVADALGHATSRVYRPRSALRQLSSDGVAEPSSTGTPSSWARFTATSRAW